MEKYKKILAIEEKLRGKLNEIHFDFDGIIYNPLNYAFNNFSSFIKLSVREEGQEVIFLGMNPGPFGMCQTGVPFGSVNKVKYYLGISGQVDKPKKENPIFPITGLDTKRNEVSGERFWSMAEKIGDKEVFFSSSVVLNYSPLCFLKKQNAANVSLPELPKADRVRIEELCSSSLEESLDVLKIEKRIALGRYAEEILSKFGKEVFLFPHPSPRNPKSRLFWPEEAASKLKEIIKC